eukprot:1196057-Prorocentrum_minimum.AAC.2
MGNRDINKMKLTSDLHPSDCARPFEAIPGAPHSPSPTGGACLYNHPHDRSTEGRRRGGGDSKGLTR